MICRRDKIGVFVQGGRNDIVNIVGHAVYVSRSGDGADVSDGTVR